jgi:glucose-1-phosphatase
MISAIIFDLGNVIVPFDPNRRIVEFEAHCAYSATEVSERIASSGLAQRFEVGEVSAEEFFQGMGRTLNLQVNYPEFCRIWSSIFLPGTLIPARLLEALHRRYRLLMLSDTDPIHFSTLLDRYPIFHHFDSRILSFEVGARKPSPRIFREAIGRAGFPANQCFFTDDVAANVEGARNEGMVAVRFHSLPQLEAELRAQGVEWE